jgi:tRNA dimethylallyltransferase
MDERAADARPPVVVVTGPTAAGKSAAAIALAERIGGEIVNADSMQVYRGLDIGTAKPSLAERARVPHHLIDVLPPDAVYSAGRFAEEARAAAAEIHARGRHVLLVGGTGLYIRAFLEGLAGGVGRDPSLRAALEEEHAVAVAEGDTARLHRRLAELDPETARRLHPHDVRRIVRALELHARTGRAPSAVRRDDPPRARYRALHLVLDPGTEELRRRIAARCEQMIARGLLQEVRALRGRGYGPELPAMQAIGYRHMQPVIDGLETLAHVLEAMKRDTWQFARRQRTWLRRVRDAVGVHPDDDVAIAGLVERFLEAEAPRGDGEEAGGPPDAGVRRAGAQKVGVV